MSELGSSSADRRYGLLLVDLIMAVTTDHGVPDSASDPHNLTERLENGVVPNVTRLVSAVRARGEPVLWSKPVVGSTAAQRQPWGARVPHIAGPSQFGITAWGPLGELRAEESDYEVMKYSCSSFWGGDADAVLRNRGVTDVLIAGCLTNHGVLIDGTDASHRGYRATIVADACAALTVADHEAAINANKLYAVADTQDVLAALDAHDVIAAVS